MADGVNKTNKRTIQILVSEGVYETLQADIQALKEQGQRDLSLAQFARDAIEKHYHEIFGRPIDLSTDMGRWGGPRDNPSSRRE